MEISKFWRKPQKIEISRHFFYLSTPCYTILVAVDSRSGLIIWTPPIARWMLGLRYSIEDIVDYFTEKYGNDFIYYQVE